MYIGFFFFQIFSKDNLFCIICHITVIISSWFINEITYSKFCLPMYTIIWLFHCLCSLTRILLFEKIIASSKISDLIYNIKPINSLLIWSYLHIYINKKKMRFNSRTPIEFHHWINLKILVEIEFKLYSLHNLKCFVVEITCNESRRVDKI